MAKSFRMTRQVWMSLLISVLLLLICCFSMIPIGTTILTSFKRQADITRKPPVFFPCDTPRQSFDITACRYAIEGYQRVFALKASTESLFGFSFTGKMLRVYLPNTIVYASVTSVLVSLVASLSGFAFSRFKFRGRNTLLTLIYAITGIPLLTNLLALYQMSVSLRNGLSFFEDRLFLIFVYLGFFLPISVWIMKGFFDAIPVEMEEAALVEGCTPIGALFRITIPLAAPGIVSVFLFTFVGVWNEFIAAYLLVTEDNYKPAMYGLYEFLSQNIINLQVIAAACIIITLPVIIVFLFARRTFFTAMLEGAVKG